MEGVGGEQNKGVVGSGIGFSSRLLTFLALALGKELAERIHYQQKYQYNSHKEKKGV